MRVYLLQGQKSVLVRLVVVLIVLLCLPAASWSFELLLGTGDRGSFSYFAGKAVCRAIARADNDMSCQPVPAENFTDNLTNLQAGSLDLALVNSKVIYDAFHRRGVFEYVALDYDQLRLLLPLYRTPVTLLVRKDAWITALDNLTGTSVNIGSGSSLNALVFKEIMSVASWHASSFKLLQNLSSLNAQDYLALHSGSVQAMLHIGVHQDKKVAQSLANGATTLIGVNGPIINRILDADIGFVNQAISPNVYPQVPNAFETLAIESMLISSSELDAQTVTKILQAITGSKKQLKSAHQSILELPVTVETLNSGYLHPHPESVLFFQANQNRL